MASNVNYSEIAFYQGRAGGLSTGFCTFSENGLYYFTCNKNNEVYLFSAGFTSAAARNRNLHKLSKNLLFAKRYERIQETKNRFYFLIKTEEQEELARSKFFATEDAMNVFIGWIMGSKFVIDYSQNINSQNPNINTTILKGNYNKYISYSIYKGSNQKLYFTYADKDENTYLLNPVVSGFDNVEEVKKMVEVVNEVARRPKAYKVNLAKSGKYFFYLKNNTETLAKSIFFNNEKEMLKVIEKLVNYKNTGRMVISSKLNKQEVNAAQPDGEKDDFEEVLKKQQKAELEVRLKKRKEEEEKKQEQTELSLEQVYQNQLHVKDNDLLAKDKKNNIEEQQNKELNGVEIEQSENLNDVPKISSKEEIQNNANVQESEKINNKKLKVRTVDANKELQEKAINANKFTEANAVEPTKKLKVRTVDANKPIEKKVDKPGKKLKVRTVDANKPAEIKAVETTKKLKVRTVDANKPVGAETVESPKKLKVRTVDANKNTNKEKPTQNKVDIPDEVEPNKIEQNSEADIAYQKKLAQDKLEALRRDSINKKQKQRKQEKKVSRESEFSAAKIIKPAIIMLLVFAMVGFGILAFLSRDKEYNTIKPIATAADVINTEPDKSDLPQFKPGKIAASAAALPDYKTGTIEHLLKNCIEDVYCKVPSNFHWVETGFEDGLSNLSLSSKASLSRIVELLKSYPQMKLNIAGHTAFGETTKNANTLSNERAKTVFEYFVQNGIAAERLAHKGMANAQPISFGNSLTSKHRNKRVDFTLVQK